MFGVGPRQIQCGNVERCQLCLIRHLLALLPWAEGGIWKKGEVLQGNVVCSNVNLFIFHIGRKAYRNPCDLPVDLIM